MHGNFFTFPGERKAEERYWAQRDPRGYNPQDSPGVRGNLSANCGRRQQHRTVSIETITSFLGALRGMASVTHILLDAALEALSHEHQSQSLSEYALNRDIKIMQREYNRRMYELEDDIKKAPLVYHTRELVSNTIGQGIKATKSIVGLMMARRERALGKSNSKVVE
nr:unnamed protein product [Digitaria exilis]